MNVKIVCENGFEQYCCVVTETRTTITVQRPTGRVKFSKRTGQRLPCDKYWSGAKWVLAIPLQTDGEVG